MIPLRDVGPFGRLLMSADQLRVLKACIQVKGGDRSSPFAGICVNVCDIVEDRATVYRYLKSAFRAWPEFSGDPYFPVPAPDGHTPVEFYRLVKNRWEGEYGEARLRLLDHCIEFLSVPRDVYA